MGRCKPGVRNVFNLYGVNRNKLEGGVLSIYNLFEDSSHTAVTMYLLNDEPAKRKFRKIFADERRFPRRLYILPQSNT